MNDDLGIIIAMWGTFVAFIGFLLVVPSSRYEKIGTRIMGVGSVLAVLGIGLMLIHATWTMLS